LLNRRVLTLLGQKGGCGKTTIAIHLAVAAQQDGEQVVIIDTDPQQSALYWYGARKHKDSEMPVVVRAAPHEINERLDQAWGDEMTLAIIDTSPHAEPAACAAAAYAHLILLPCRPTALDIRALTAAVAIARASSNPAAIVLNGCPIRAPEVAEARTVLTEHATGKQVPVPVLDVTICDRRAFFRALASGRSVTEFEPHGRAAEEVRALWKWSKEQLQ
jgi:chromosome partitioning protein